MVEKHKASTPAERQIQRLETLRLEKEKEKAAPKRPTRPLEDPTDAVERTLRRLEAMRELASQSGPAMPPVLPPIEEMGRSVPRERSVPEGVTEKPQRVPPLDVLPPKGLSPETMEVPAPTIPLDLPVAPDQVPVDPPRTIDTLPEELQVLAPPPPPFPVVSDGVVSMTAPPPPPPVPLEEPAALSEEMAANEGPGATRGAFPKFDGRLKNIKLSVAQMKMLEQLFDVDPRLYPARVLRLALNQWWGLSNLPEDQALEPLSRDALIRIQKGL